MRITNFKQVFKSGLVALLTGTAFLWPVKNASAAASLTSSTSSFISADLANRPDYMDSAGVWNGSIEVTNTLGDTFRLVLRNDASLNNVQDNTAFGIDLSAGLPTGFRLPVPTFSLGTVTVSIATLFTDGSPADIAPQCSYTFNLGLTTSTVIPFVVNGNYTIDFTINYTDFLTAPDPQTETETIVVEVRAGDVAITKENISPGPVANGAPANFNVSAISSTTGGIFNVVVTDTLSAGFDPASLQMTAAPGTGVFSLPAATFTIPYIAGNSPPVLIGVEANVQVDVNAVACPVLDNQVNVTDRTGKTDTSAAVVAFNLQEPVLSFSAPNTVIPLNASATTYSIVVSNTGSGEAKNISLAAPGIGTDLDNFGINVVSPGWVFDSLNDVFTFNGTLPAGSSQTLSFTLLAQVCPPPDGGVLNWALSFQNICGTPFNPAIQSAELSVGGVRMSPHWVMAIIPIIMILCAI